MHLRQDALAAAAEWIVHVERTAQQTDGLVATVGRVDTVPGAVNVIAGVARATLDVRHAVDAVRAAAVDRIFRYARRGISVTWAQHMDQPSVRLQWQPVARAVAACGYPVHGMPSGAGHDAMILAKHRPSSMLFLRSPGGISHHPDELVREEDVAAALAVGARFLDHWRPG
jgi:allantoate deiminase